MTNLHDVLGDLTEEQIRAAVAAMSPEQAEALLNNGPLMKPRNPLEQALAIDMAYRTRPHLKYLSDRLAEAVAAVERGEDRYMVVSMPPRMGKSQLSSVYLPVWLLAQHPDWPIGLISHDPSLAVKWGRDVRNVIEEHDVGVDLAAGSTAMAEWETTERGGVLSRSVGQSITGRGFKVLIVDDAVKDYAEAHSATKRDTLWNWWTANAQTRKTGPWLVVFIGTRWHEDDLLGRIQNPEFEGDVARWEKIVFPAIAEDTDVLGRKPGEPLLSPIEDETTEQALSRWEKIKRSVGTYTWNALYQQRPSPAKGMIFNADWWRFWTTNPDNVSVAHEEGCTFVECGCPEDGRVVLLENLDNARWTDSWDMAFKAKAASDYVVGQRWALMGSRRYLLYQERKRRTFTETVGAMKRWLTNLVPWSEKVFERLVEDKANGTAVIDSLKEEVSGIIPVNPTESKEGRARSVTPDCEGGNVYFPFPGDPGNEWVQDLLSELREFPAGKNDDQVDCLTQYLNRVRIPVQGSISKPGNVTTLTGRRRGQVALAYGQGRYAKAARGTGR